MNIDLKGTELARYLVQNKDRLIAEKKSAMKLADACSFVGGVIGKEGVITKDGLGVVNTDGAIRNTTIINTCLWYDSHGDVHIPKIWNKSLADNGHRAVNMIPLMQEHQMKFDKVIADRESVKPYVTAMSWKALGVDFPGETEVLAFDNVISPDRNPFMYDQYKNGYVFNHSVGMQYVDIALAINTGERDMKDYKKVWDKYIDLIANREDAEFEGYFWAVTQAKVIEGSAVLRGSNIITPTLNTGTEPPKDTLNEPERKSTQANSSIFSIIKSIKK